MHTVSKQGLVHVIQEGLAFSVCFGKQHIISVKIFRCNAAVMHIVRLYKVMKTIGVVEMEVLIRFRIDIFDGVSVFHSQGAIGLVEIFVPFKLSRTNVSSHSLTSDSTVWFLVSELSMAARILCRILNT